MKSDMARVRLLERLNRNADERAERRVRDEDRVRRSVITHIGHLLNTRRGNVPTDPEFGMPEIPQRGNDSAHRGEEVIDRAVRELLERYEPRVTDVEVVSRGFSGRQLGLEIEIKASVAYPKRPLPLRVRGTVLADGRFVFDGGTGS